MLLVCHAVSCVFRSTLGPVRRRRRVDDPHAMAGSLPHVHREDTRNMIRCMRAALLLWLSLQVPTATAASLPMEPLRPAPGVVSDEPSGNTSSIDFTFVSDGSYDAPLAFMETSMDQHGRALGYVSTASSSCGTADISCGCIRSGTDCCGPCCPLDPTQTSLSIPEGRCIELYSVYAV